MNDMTTYEELRSQLQTGDLLTYRTDGIVSAVIRWWSTGANHAGLVLDLKEYCGQENRKWTLEAVAGGVKLALLSRKLETIQGEVLWHPIKEEYDFSRQKIGEEALSYVGIEYDFGSLFKNIFGLVSADMKKFFCSEYVFISWREAGLVTGDKAPLPSMLEKLGVTGPPSTLVKS